MSLPVCTRCGKGIQPADAAFCPYCGTPAPTPASSLSDSARMALSEADKLRDPVKKYDLLCRALAENPDCLEIAEALLFHGRLHERDSRKLDFTVIKCYLWHMYLTPGDFSPEQKNAMRRELFDHPDLERCLALAPDRDAYMRRYLRRLGCEFVTLFLKGSNRFTRTLFGFRFDNRMSRVLAQPAAQMIVNIRTDDALTPVQRSLLTDAIYAAFLTETGGEPQWINDELDKLGHPVPTHRE